MVESALLVLALVQPPGARAESLKDVREQLLVEYEGRVASGVPQAEAWDQTVARSHELERSSPRRAFVKEVLQDIDDDVHVLGAIPVRDGEAPVIRTGKDPIESRGQFSDEDFECRSPRCVERFRRSAAERGLPVRQDRLSMVIDEYDTLVWKPPPKPPPTHALGAAWDQAIFETTQREYAPSAKPGVRARPMESVLDNLNKGFEGLSKPPDAWGRSYEALDRFTVTSKDVLRSFEQTGLCEERPADCDWLRRKRTMADPPAATDELRREGFRRDQQRLRSLMRDSFESAEGSLRAEARQLERSLRNPDLDPARRLELIDQATALRDKMRRMFSRFDALHEQDPQLLQYVSGSRERSRFLAGLQDEIGRLGQGIESATRPLAGEAARNAQSARRAARRLHGLNVVLTAAELGRCMTEGNTATECVIQALRDAAMGLAVTESLAALSVVTPTGVVLASAALTAVGTGYMIVESSVQVYHLLVESYRLAAAHVEEYRSEQRLSEAQQANVARFREQYARELAAFEEIARRVGRAKRAQLARLDFLEELYAVFAQDLQWLGESLALHEPRLLQVQAQYTQLAESCHLLGHLDHRAEAAADLATRAEAGVTSGLTSARAALVSCESATAVDQAESTLAEASAALDDLADRLNDLRELREQVESARPELAASLGQAGGGTNLVDEVEVALEQLLGLSRRIQSSHDYLEADYSAEVAALNGWIAAQRAELEGRVQRFEYSFPPEMVESEPGFAVLRMHLAAVEPLPPSAWEARWKALRTQFPSGWPAKAALLVQKVHALTAQFPRGSMESCRAPLDETLARVDGQIGQIEGQLSASRESLSRGAGLLFLPRQRCVAQLGPGAAGSGDPTDADQARRRRLERIGRGTASSSRTTDYHSPEARQRRAREEAQRREQERREREAAAERRRARQRAAESFGRGLADAQAPRSDVDPGPPASRDSGAERSSPWPRDKCEELKSEAEFERCALMGIDCASSAEKYGCVRYCRCFPNHSFE